MNWAKILNSPWGPLVLGSFAAGLMGWSFVSGLLGGLSLWAWAEATK